MIAYRKGQNIYSNTDKPNTGLSYLTAINIAIL